MKKIIETPCLPENDVATVLVSSEFPEIQEALTKKFNIDTIQIPKNTALTEDISTHPDCVFTQLDNHSAVSDQSVYDIIVNYLTIEECTDFFKVYKTTDSVKSPYPNDVRLNIRVIADMILCNTKYVDTRITEFAEKHNYRLIHCNQGYTACSSVILNNNALITDDESIHHSAVSNGIDSLLINKGSVKLKGQPYGFIGGTCGMISKNLLAFSGKLDTHTDAELIKSFLLKHNIDYIELSDNPLTDIGGIIPLLWYQY